MPGFLGKKPLQTMYDSHLANILLCEEPASNHKYYPARA